MTARTRLLLRNSVEPAAYAIQSPSNAPVSVGALFQAELKQQGHEDERGNDQEKTKARNNSSDVLRLRRGIECAFSHRLEGEPDVAGWRFVSPPPRRQRTRLSKIGWR